MCPKLTSSSRHVPCQCHTVLRIKKLEIQYDAQGACSASNMSPKLTSRHVPCCTALRTKNVKMQHDASSTKLLGPKEAACLPGTESVCLGPADCRALGRCRSWTVWLHSFMPTSKQWETQSVHTHVLISTCNMLCIIFTHQWPKLSHHKLLKLKVCGQHNSKYADGDNSTKMIRATKWVVGKSWIYTTTCLLVVQLLLFFVFFV